MALSFATAQGFPSFALLFRYRNGARPVEVTLTNHPPEWISAYQRNVYRACDPVRTFALERSEPLWFPEGLQDDPDYPDQRALFPLERNYMRLAKRHLLHRGLAVPMHGPADSFMLLVLTGRAEGQAPIDRDVVEQETRNFVWAMFPAMQRLFLPRKSKKSTNRKEAGEKEARPAALAPREVQVLQLLASGLCMKKIGSELKCHDRTVNLTLNNAKKKLRVSSTHQAIASAVAAGHITFVGYQNADPADDDIQFLSM